ncbi:unnamed protein product [Callosobruchus maculatus]|uniref:Tudor domain-containing protein n=1 Tax=Callosobruchus maculatus TaxID=64391 RepID=A0A653CZ86_CALMS|nr:unnamed protein product [Callosobruchus maculatus]
MKSLPSNLLSLAVYATRCTLNAAPPDGEWSTAANERFAELTVVEDLTAEFLDQDEKKNYVELYSEGQNVKDILIKENLAVPVNQSAETKITGFVSHQNSPSEFWMQLENCVDELEWIAEQLSTAETFPELEDHSPGTLCAALFPDDMMWYRARVLSNTVAGVELLFIDYGNSCASDGTALRKLPEELSMTPPLAQKCSLKKPTGLQQWSKRMATKFAEISAEGQAIFTVKKLSTGETSVVELVLDGKDVTSLLLPETEIGHVKDLVGLDNFHIEKNGEILPDTFRLEEVNGVNWSEDSLQKFRDLNQEGTTFEIEFLEDNTVCLYLDGRDIKYDLVPPKSPQKAPKADPVKELSPTDETILVDLTNEDSEAEKTNKPPDTVTDISPNDQEILVDDTNQDSESEKTNKPTIETETMSKNNGEKSDLTEESSKEEVCEKSDDLDVPHTLTDQHPVESETSKEVNEASKQSEDVIEESVSSKEEVCGKPDDLGEPHQHPIESDISKDANEASKQSDEGHTVMNEELEVPSKASEKLDESEALAVSDEHPKGSANLEIATSKKPIEEEIKDVEKVEKDEETCKPEQTETDSKAESTEISKGLSTEGI